MLILDTMSYCSDPALGWLLNILKTAFTVIQVIVPILLILGLGIQFGSKVINPEDDKAKDKIKNSITAAVIVFFLPLLINLLMFVLGNNYNLSECWNNSKVYSSGTQYIKKPSKSGTDVFYVNSEDYAPGSNGVDPNYWDGLIDDTPDTGNGESWNGEVIEGNAQTYKDVVWDPNDVTKISNLTSAQLTAILNAYGGNAKNFIPYAVNYVTVEQKYHINLFFFISLHAIESGWITSSVSNTCNNLGGWKDFGNPSYVCARAPANEGSTPYRYFTSKGAFIDYVGNSMKTNYLTLGGSHYNGTSVSGIIHDYNNGSVSEINSINKIARELFSHVSEVM